MAKNLYCVVRVLPVFFIFYNYADVAELVDALGLGSSAARRGGSSPFIRTNIEYGVILIVRHNNIY